MGEERKVYYKVLDENMYSTYAHFEYELNKTYTTNEEIEPCENGFHACKNMYELVLWYKYHSIKECKFFKCYLGDTIVEDIHKVVSDSITLMEEIPFEVIDKEIRDNMELLVNDKTYWVRIAVAEQGYGLETLIKDKYWRVREAVAEQGYGLETLIDDDDPDVRIAVAKQSYGLNKLINDKDNWVRVAVAEQGYGLDRLIDDDDPYVREAVANQGYGLDRLIDDHDPDVRIAAKIKLKEREGK